MDTEQAVAEAKLLLDTDEMKSQPIPAG
jgi:hypothetical protein